MKGMGPKAKDADLWTWIWEEVRSLHQEGILSEVEHVKAYRSKKEKKHMSLLAHFVTEGNERADEQKRASTVQQRTERRLTPHCSTQAADKKRDARAQEKEQFVRE